MPNLASCHHFIRRSRSACTSGLSTSAWLGFAAGAFSFWQLVLNPEAARAAPVPIRKNESRLEILFSDMVNPPVAKMWAHVHLKSVQSILPKSCIVNEFGSWCSLGRGRSLPERREGCTCRPPVFACCLITSLFSSTFPYYAAKHLYFHRHTGSARQFSTAVFCFQ